MAISRYTFDDLFEGWDNWPWSTPGLTWAYKGRIYDPEKYELVPKKSYITELISKKEEEQKALQERLESIKKEINELKNK